MEDKQLTRLPKLAKRSISCSFCKPNIRCSILWRRWCWSWRTTSF
jgi:hypothetical protein